MGFTTGLTCVKCGAQHTHRNPFFRCLRCGGLLDPTYDYDALADWFNLDEVRKRENNLWKWKEFLPIEDESKIVTLGEGGTPLLKCDKIAEEVGIKELYVKDDAMTQPTGSLRDRSIPVAATKALEFGYEVLTSDSWGNKAASVAAYAARAGLKSVIFCPAQEPLEKLAQSLMYGAKLLRIKANMSEVNKIYQKILSIYGPRVRWYDCGRDNPFRYEGKKTYAYEVMDSLNWQFVPDRIFHPSAGSLSVVKIYKGYSELRLLGKVSELPKMVVVQPEACAPIVRAYKEGKTKVEPVPEDKTVASAITLGNPGDLGDLTLKAIKESKGTAVTVTDEEIVYGVKLLGREGIFSEPSGAAGIPAVKKLVEGREIDRDERVVVDVTGSGLRDLEAAMGMVEMPSVVEPDFGTVEKSIMKLVEEM